MEFIKYDVKTLSNTPTDSIALNRLADAVFAEAEKQTEEEFAPLRKDLHLTAEEYANNPSFSGGFPQFESTDQQIDLVEHEKPALTADCECSGNKGCECDEDKSFFDKVKTYTKKNWKWLIPVATVIVAGALFLIFKKK